MPAEFFVTVTRKLAAPLSVADAYVRVENYLRVWTVYDLSGLAVLEAARRARSRLNFWDAQIWAAARLNQPPVVFSEYFRSGLPACRSGVVLR